MKTSKSPLAVACVAYKVAKQSLPPYSHARSPHVFTLPQIVACLVLKEFFTTDYRGIVAILADSSDIQKALELKEIPHFTTLQKASQRLTKQRIIEKLLKRILALTIQKKTDKAAVNLAAIDGTGFESHHTSHYFIARRTQGLKSQPRSMLYTRFPKIGLVVDVASYLILAGIPDRGPRFDSVHFKPALGAAAKIAHIRTLVADAGYDSEANHVCARRNYNIRAIIPAIQHRWKNSVPKSHYRKLMHTNFPKKIYRQRWQIETTISMLKRHLGSCLRARNYWSQCREMLLRIFTHNVMVVLR